MTAGPTNLTEREAAEYLHLSLSTLRRMRQRRRGPVYWTPSDAPNAPILYTRRALDAWIARRSRK